MKLVVDTNVVFSALIADGMTRELVLNEALSLYVPEFFRSEFDWPLETIRRRSGLTESELHLLVVILFEDVHVNPRDDFEDAIPVATELIGTSIRMTYRSSLWPSPSTQESGVMTGISRSNPR